MPCVLRRQPDRRCPHQPATGTLPFMPSEIERKFLVPAAPDELRRAEGTALRQGYLACEGNVEVRVRRTDDNAVLTVKGGHGLRRTEVEVALPTDAADELWSLCGERWLAKTRYRVPVGEGDDVAEVDVYEGPLAPLCVAEVEFASAAAAAAF